MLTTRTAKKILILLSSRGLQTSLLHRLQTQTLTDATPLIGKIFPIQQNCYNFELVMQFCCPPGCKEVFTSLQELYQATRASPDCMGVAVGGKG